MAKNTEEVRVKADNTAVLRCHCANAFQDREHGPGMRVHNRTKQSKQVVEQKWRCTSCRDEKAV